MGHTECRQVATRHDNFQSSFLANVAKTVATITQSQRASRRWAWPRAGEVTKGRELNDRIQLLQLGLHSGSTVKCHSVRCHSVKCHSVRCALKSVHPRETRGRRMGVGIVTDHTHRNRAGGMSRLNRLVQALFMETPATMCGAIALRGLKRCR